MSTEILDCCKTKVSPKNLSHHQFIDCFKSKKFFKQKTSDGRKIEKEIVLLTLCPNCKHYILKYLWYTKKSARFYDYDDSKILRGEKADEVYLRRCDDFELYTLPNPYKRIPSMKCGKKIPWVYGKALNAYTQVYRYLDESGNAGRKIYKPSENSFL